MSRNQREGKYAGYWKRHWRGHGDKIYGELRPSQNYVVVNYIFQ